jgi:hypothetical protein
LWFIKVAQITLTTRKLNKYTHFKKCATRIEAELNAVKVSARLY